MQRQRQQLGDKTLFKFIISFFFSFFSILLAIFVSVFSFRSFVFGFSVEVAHYGSEW